jgi:hypothetical protein
MLAFVSARKITKVQGLADVVALVEFLGFSYEVTEQFSYLSNAQIIFAISILLVLALSNGLAVFLKVESLNQRAKFDPIVEKQEHSLFFGIAVLRNRTPLGLHEDTPGFVGQIYGRLSGTSGKSGR